MGVGTPPLRRVQGSSGCCRIARLAASVVLAASLLATSGAPARATYPSNQPLEYGAIFLETVTNLFFFTSITATGVGETTPFYSEPTCPGDQFYSPAAGPGGRIAIAPCDPSMEQFQTGPIRIVTPPDGTFVGHEWSFDPSSVPVPPEFILPGTNPADYHFRHGLTWAGPDRIALMLVTLTASNGLAIFDISDPGNVVIDKVIWSGNYGFELINDFRFSADGSHYAYRKDINGPTLTIVDTTTGQDTAHFPDEYTEHYFGGPNYSWSPNGDLLAVNLVNQGTFIFDINGTLQDSITGTLSLVSTWAPDGSGMVLLEPELSDPTWSNLNLVYYPFGGGAPSVLTSNFYHDDWSSPNFSWPVELEWIERPGLLTETATTPGGDDIVVALDGGGAIQNVTATDPPGAIPAPPGASFPYGLVGFDLVGVPPGGTAEVTIDYPAPLPEPFAYYKLQNSTYVDATSIATHDNGRVTLTLVDNGPFDDDPTPGVIRDPGGPATISNTPHDSFDIALTGARTHTAAGDLDTGNFKITSDTRGIRSITGTGTVATTTVTTNVNRFWSFDLWTGSVIVSDPAIGTVNTPLFGRVTPAGTDGAKATMRWFDFRRLPWRSYDLRWEIHDRT